MSGYLNEKWAAIPGYEGLYEVSSCGRIMSIKNGSNKITVGSEGQDGYFRISLFKNNEQKKYLVHRLVALTFIPNPYGYLEINHIDGIKSNNTVENLEWCTRSHNVKEAFRLGLKVNKKGSESLLAKQFYQFDLKGKLLAHWGSVSDCGNILNIPHQDISQNLTGRSMTCHGYIFSYSDTIDMNEHRPFSSLCEAIRGYNPKTGSVILLDSIKSAEGFVTKEGAVLCASNVNKVLKGKRETCAGYRWEYVNSDKENEITRTYTTVPSCSKAVIQKDLNGNILNEFVSAHEADRQTGISYKLISEAATGRKKTAKGFIWEYKK